MEIRLNKISLKRLKTNLDKFSFKVHMSVKQVNLGNLQRKLCKRIQTVKCVNLKELKHVNANSY